MNATGLVHTGRAWIRSVTLTPAAAVATLTIDDSLDGSGTDKLSLQAAAEAQGIAAHFGTLSRLKTTRDIFRKGCVFTHPFQ